MSNTNTLITSSSHGCIPAFLFAWSWKKTQSNLVKHEYTSRTTTKKNKPKMFIFQYTNCFLFGVTCQERKSTHRNNKASSFVDFGRKLPPSVFFVILNITINICPLSLHLVWFSNSVEMVKTVIF